MLQSLLILTSKTRFILSKFVLSFPMVFKVTREAHPEIRTVLSRWQMHNALNYLITGT